MSAIYFDYNSTTPLSPKSREAFLQAQDMHWQNPMRSYRSGLQVHKLLEDERAFWANELCCSPKQIIFTSGATEATNAVIRYAKTTLAQPGQSIAASAVEHACILKPAQDLFGEEFLLILPVTKAGVIDVEASTQLIAQKKPALVALMAVNNETGVRQPWELIQSFCKEQAIPFLCDAAQLMGKVSLGTLGNCDFVIGCAHKFGGPKGTGFLKLPLNCREFQITVGGGQEMAYRSGTVNYPAITAMRAAYQENLKNAIDTRFEKLVMRQQFEQQVQQLIPGTHLVAAEAERLWNTVSLIMPAFSSDRWIAQLDKLGIEVASGSACHAKGGGMSPVLKAMGYSAEEGRRYIRISSGWETKATDWQTLLEGLTSVWELLKNEGESCSLLTKTIEI